VLVVQAEPVAGLETPDVVISHAHFYRFVPGQDL
jgi:hypothetical protein